MAMVRASWKKSLKDLSCGRVMAPLAVEGKGFLNELPPRISSARRILLTLDQRGCAHCGCCARNRGRSLAHLECKMTFVEISCELCRCNSNRSPERIMQRIEFRVTRMITRRKRSLLIEEFSS